MNRSNEKENNPIIEEVSKNEFIIRVIILDIVVLMPIFNNYLGVPNLWIYLVLLLFLYVLFNRNRLKGNLNKKQRRTFVLNSMLIFVIIILRAIIFS
jgi:hypothetical protein